MPHPARVRHAPPAIAADTFGVRPFAVLTFAVLASCLAPGVARAVVPEVELPAAPDTLLVDRDAFEEVVPLLDDLDCADLDEYAYANAPDLVVGGRPGLLVDLLDYWEDACGRSEPLERMRILGAIWDGAFDESLYGDDIIDWLGIRQATRDDPDRSAARRAFDVFTVSFADQMLPHVPDASLEQFFCLFYAGREAEAWALLDGEALADSWLRFYRDDELRRLRTVDRTLIVALTLGTWRAQSDFELAGDHTMVGALVEQHRRGRFVRLAGELRLGRTARPYRVIQDPVDARSDRFEAFYLGAEGGFEVLRHGRFAANVFAALGFDGIRPFRDEDILLGTYNVGLGIGARWRPWAEQPWVLTADARAEWIGERNEGVDSLAGSATSLRVGIGYAHGWQVGRRVSALAGE